MKKLQDLNTKFVDASLFFDERNASMILVFDGVKTSGQDIDELIKKQKEEWKKRASDLSMIEKELELIRRKIRPEYRELGRKIREARSRCDYIVVADTRWLSIALCPYTSRFFVIYNEDKIPMKINITSKDPRSLLEELRRIGAVNGKEYDELREQVERIRIIEYPESLRAWEELRKLAKKTRGMMNVRGVLRLVKKVGVGNYEEVRIEGKKAIYRVYYITFDENVNPRIVTIDFDLNQYDKYPILAMPRTL